MTQYLVAIHLPDDFDPEQQDASVPGDISALNEEMITRGIRVFVGGLRPAGSARSLRAEPNGEVVVTEGPYLKTSEHVGGFWVLECADLDEAVEWGKKATVACRAPVEVREFRAPPPERLQARREAEARGK